METEKAWRAPRQLQMVAWSTLVNLSVFKATQMDSALSAMVNAGLKSPVAGFVVLATFLGFWLFTDTHSSLYRYIAGSVHALGHLMAVFLLAWAATSISVLWFEYGSSWQLVVAVALIFAAGWIVGSFHHGDLPARVAQRVRPSRQ